MWMRGVAHSREATHTETDSLHIIYMCVIMDSVCMCVSMDSVCMCVRVCTCIDMHAPLIM